MNAFELSEAKKNKETFTSVSYFLRFIDNGAVQLYFKFRNSGKNRFFFTLVNRGSIIISEK